MKKMRPAGLADGRHHTRSERGRVARLLVVASGPWMWRRPGSPTLSELAQARFHRRARPDSPCADTRSSDAIAEMRALAQDSGPAFFTTANKQGWLPAHVAARLGQVEVLRWIAAYYDGLGLTEVTQNPHKLTLAHLAARGGHLEVLRFLVETQGVRILTALDAEGWSPAHSASRANHLHALQFIINELGGLAPLLSAMANASSPTLENVAARYGHKRLLRYLKQQADRIDYSFVISTEDWSHSTRSSGSTWITEQDLSGFEGEGAS